MRASSFTLAGLAILAATANAHVTQAQNQSGPPQIVVTGTAEAHVVPDRATVFVGVMTRAATAAAAAEANTRKQRAILDTLRAAGLASDQLKTSNYSVSPETRYDNTTQTTHVTGYAVSNTVVVDIRHMDQVSTVIDASLAKGANQISALQFYSSVADSVRRSALAEATANARKDADVLARAAGGTLGPLLELSTETPAIRPMTRALSFGSSSMATAMPTPIESGEQIVSASVSARWTFLSSPHSGGQN